MHKNPRASRLLCLIGLVLTSCAQITVRTGDRVDIVRGLGVGQIRVDQPDHPISVETDGVGVVVGYGHVALGHLQETLVLFPDNSRCRVLFILQNENELERTLAILRQYRINLETICVQGAHHD